jgi:chromate transporter
MDASIRSDEAPPIITHRDLFLTFAKIGLLGFGGVTPWLRRILVEERGWLNDRELAELFGFASTLPGANTVSISIMLGDRYQGPTGALVAIVGLLAMPLTILAASASLYDDFASTPAVQDAIAGAAAATAGLVLGNAFKMIGNMKPDLSGYLIGGAAFVAAGLLHLPLLWTLAVLIPAGIVLATVRSRSR